MSDRSVNGLLYGVEQFFGAAPVGTERELYTTTTDIRPHEEDIVRHTILGKSGLDVSRIAFGTWQLGGDWGQTDTVAATAAIRRAADRGVTFFDTAQAYGFGRSEQLLGAALAGLARHQLVIATKGGLRSTDTGLVRDASGGWIREGVEASLRALDTDYIDLSRSIGPILGRRSRRRQRRWSS
jgi:Aldo/keto reductase family